jgi:hypothetical protein
VSTQPEVTRTIVFGKGKEALRRAQQFDAIFEDQEVMDKIEAAYSATQPEDSKPWSWKRRAWWGAAALSGMGLSWLLHKKAPMINHAACASLGKALGEQIGLKGRMSAIPGATLTLGSYWAQDNMPLVAIAAAAIGHAECIGTAGEFIVNRVIEAKEARLARKEVEETTVQESQTEVSREEASHAS